MNNKEALDALHKGKTIRKKSVPKPSPFRSLYLHDKEYYFSQYTPFVNKDNQPIVFANSTPKCFLEDSYYVLFNTIECEWEECIPLYDYLGEEFKESIISEKNRLIKKLKDSNITIQQAKLSFSEYITDLIYRQKKQEEDQDVLNFINSFCSSGSKDDFDKAISTYSVFSSSHSFYFAKILEEAFIGVKRGKIYLCYPYGYIVWMYNKVPYSINGADDRKPKLYIPIDYLSDQEIANFKHIEKYQKIKNESETETINVFCENFLREVGFGGIFEEALGEE